MVYTLETLPWITLSGLVDHCSAFQAGILAIIKVAKHIEAGFKDRDIFISSESEFQIRTSLFAQKHYSHNTEILPYFVNN